MLLIGLHATHQLDSDEGLILHGAWSILNGRRLYTDFFEFVAPGSFYLVAALWKVFGPHFWIAKAFAILTIAAAALGVYRISHLLVTQQQLAVPRWATLFGPVVLCLFSGYWPAINHNTFACALIIWSAFFIARSMVRRDRGDAAIGGFICGLAILFLQHRGAILAATGALSICLFQADQSPRKTWGNAAAFLAGVLIPLAAMLLYWPASLLLENLVRFPASHYLEVNRVDRSLFVGVGTLILLAGWLLRQGSRTAVWFLVALQVTLFISALQRPDLSHLTAILFPLLALFPLLLNAASAASKASRFFLIWIAAGLLLLNAAIPIVIATRSSTPFFEMSQHPALRYVREKCTASPFVYAGPFSPGYYFETGKLNPTRYSFLLTNLSTKAQFAEAAASIEAHRPQCMVMNYSAVEKFNYDRNNVVDEYIRGNYALVYAFGRLQVWMRKAGRRRANRRYTRLSRTRR